MLPSAITDWIRSIIIYMLLVSVLLHLIPDESYRKYVRIAVGLLLLLIVIEPVSSLFSDGSAADFLTEELPEGTWSGQEELFRQEAEAAQEQALCEAYEAQLRESVTQYVQAQGYILREAEIDVTADGVQKMRLQVSANPDADEMRDHEDEKGTAAAASAGNAKEVTDTAGDTMEMPDVSGEKKGMPDAAKEDNEMAEGRADNIRQQEKQLQADLCEQYALEEEAVSVTIRVG